MSGEGEQAAAVELVHAIGFNGGASSPLHVAKTGTEYYYASGGCVVIAELGSDVQQSFLRGHDDVITCMAHSSSGQYLVSGQNGENSDAVVWDLATKSERYRLQQHDHGVAIVAFTECERFLLTIGDPKVRHPAPPDARRATRARTPPPLSSRGAPPHPPPPTSQDGKLVVWDMHTGCIVAERNGLRPTDCACWGGRVKDVKKRDTKMLQFVTGGQDCVWYWTLNPEDGQLSESKLNMGTHSRNFSAVAFSADRELLYAGSTSGDFSAIHVHQKARRAALQPAARPARASPRMTAGGVPRRCSTRSRRAARTRCRWSTRSTLASTIPMSGSSSAAATAPSAYGRATRAATAAWRR